MIINPYIFSRFILTNGVFGDGSNDYLQVRNSGGTPYSFTATGQSWTLEYWIKPPTTLTTQEGTFSSNPTNTLVNLMIANYIDRTADAGYYFQTFEGWNSASSSIMSQPNPIPLPAVSANRFTMHICITCEYTGTVYRFRQYVNAVPCDITASSTEVATAYSALGFNYLTDRVVAGRFSDTNLYGTRFYSRALSFSEVVQSYNEGRWSEPIGSGCQWDFRFSNRTGDDFADNTGSTTKITGVNFADIASNLTTPTQNPLQIRVVFDGNSMVYGTGSSSGRRKTLPMQTMRSLNDNVTYEACYNLGIAGQTTAQIITSFPTNASLCFDGSKSKNIYVPWEGTNDLFFGASVATTQTNLQTLWSLGRSRGYKVVAMTILPRSNSGTPGTFEADRQTVNTWIRANSSLYDALADVAANTTIGDAGDETNATYYSDLVHMTDAGYAIAAGIVATAIQTIP